MNRLTGTAALVGMALATASATAQSGAALSLELNRVDPIENACRLTFVARNTLGADITSLTLETVLIDADGLVERLTLFDFGPLPTDVMRVRQFDLPDLDCAALGRVLINGVSICEGPERCGDVLDLTSRTDVELLG